MSRVVFSAFGSGGDVFPSLAVAETLSRSGHDCTVIAPRGLALYARHAGFRVVSVGDGSDIAAPRDVRLMTTRFDGFASWRRTLNKYVTAYVRSALSGAARALEDIRPDVVVHHPFCGVGPIAADALKIPRVCLHLYPQLLFGRRRVGQAMTNFACEFADLLRDLEPPEERARRGRTRSLELGASGAATIVTHDPALHPDTNLGDCVMTGYPYWDRVESNERDVEVVESLISAATGDLIVVTQGSFLGLYRQEIWHRLLDVPAFARRPVLYVGVPTTERVRLENEPRRYAVGFVPMSNVVPHALLVLHHGGIGTTYGCVGAGVPAVVFPQAFDQMYNGRLLEAAHAGRICMDSGQLRKFDMSAVEDLRHGAISVADALIRPRAAAAHIAERVLTVARLSAEAP